MKLMKGGNPRQPEKISIGVRDLTLVHRHGSLSSSNLDYGDSLEGQRLHKIFTRLLHNEDKLRSASTPYADFCLNWQTESVWTELSMSISFVEQDLDLTVRGRIDQLVIKNGRLHLFEVKSTHGDPSYIPTQGHTLHRAQLLIYAAYLLQADVDILCAKLCKNIQVNNSQEILSAIIDFQKQPENCLHLAYLPVDAPEIYLRTLSFTRREILDFFDLTCRIFKQQLDVVRNWQSARNAANRIAAFPFNSLREGQRDFMSESLASMRYCTSLVVAAPTGIGKTLSALYPALKAQTRNYFKRIFYATSMNTTRLAAADALRQLRQSGFKIRSILLKAKELSCLAPDLYCDHNLCPFARDYYQRLPEAMRALLLLEDVRPAEIHEVAQKYQLCPFELSLDFAEYCDVVIGDYNHVFDPRVKLSRFINDQNRTCLLIDEAHNLPERANLMYSAALELAEFENVLSCLRDYLPKFEDRYTALFNRLYNLVLSLNTLSKSLSSEDYEAKISKPLPLPQSGELIDPAQIIFKQPSGNLIRNRGFLGDRQKPDQLLSELGNLLYLLNVFIKENSDFEEIRIFQDVFYDCLHFIRIAAFYFDDTYLTHIQCHNGRDNNLVITLDCLDASAKIAETYQDRHPAIFFSATLKPLDYYSKLLSTPTVRDLGLISTLNLCSPFPREHRFLATTSAFSLKYHDREETVTEIAEFILDVCADQRGNYLVFAPSFSYLRLLAKEIRELVLLRHELGELEKTKLVFQRQDMRSADRDKFLSHFRTPSESTLIGFAVLGSHFNEGIDLPGKCLSGVIVLSCGLPVPDIRRQIIADYFENKFGNGYLYAYIYPGFNKLEQAVGRLIRSENDTGFALLIDHRYAEPVWQQLLPVEWQAHNYTNLDNLLLDIHEFHRFIAENEEIES